MNLRKGIEGAGIGKSGGNELQTVVIRNSQKIKNIKKW